MFTYCLRKRPTAIRVAPIREGKVGELKRNLEKLDGKAFRRLLSLFLRGSEALHGNIVIFITCSSEKSRYFHV